MDDRRLCAVARKEFSRYGFALLLYYFIFCVCVFAVEWGKALPSGLGYIIACGIGAVLIVIWKRKSFLTEMFRPHRAMRPGRLLMLLCIIIACQAAFQIFAFVIEMILNQFGLSALPSIQNATATTNSLSLYLYACIVAPIFEELAFRGVLLSSLRHYGKGFAIMASAFLFAIFHGNLVQSPYAFLCGLILGYAAVEFSLLWSIVLHLFNNWVLGDLLQWLLELFPEGIGDFVWTALIWLCAAAAAVILWVKRRRVVAYFQQNKPGILPVKAFFTNAGVVFAMVLLTVVMILGVQ